MRIFRVMILALAVMAPAAGAGDSSTLAKCEGYRFDIDGSLFLKGERVRTFAAEDVQMIQIDLFGGYAFFFGFFIRSFFDTLIFLINAHGNQYRKIIFILVNDY